ncbi:MAG: hypothetical protein DPW12_00615 [Rhodocyclaceae bacterium]|nr:hypothetical protein [Zoogloeaceae bacterium]MCQ3922705.1 hypothetical protein [Rhodocyclaceae bacterium]HNQ57316.1 hypothetical protein [Candidatus Desulfobacillus denitrificans]HNT64064.1 hypothetical protein [Candidatus Desulfobacillus denitrificans]
MASLPATSEIEKEREPLDQELVAQLSDEDVDAFAEACAFPAILQTAREGSKEKIGLTREK